MRLNLIESVGLVAVCLVLSLVSDDWLPGACLLVFLVGSRLLATDDRIYVLPLAFGFHWNQTSLGVFYGGLTGRTLDAVSSSDYRPMVLIGLVCCLALAGGIRLGMSFIKAPDPDEERPGFAFSLSFLVIVYVVTVVLEGGMTRLIQDYPSLRQIIVTVDSARLGILFLMLRRLLQPVPRWGLIATVVAGEVVLGMTGFFAGFREPIVLAGLAMLEIFDRRNARHWIAIGLVGATMIGLGMVWMGVRVDYRREFMAVDNFQASRSARVDRIGNLATDWFHSDPQNMWQTADSLINRMWTVYYPALAMKRVPDALPHTDGSILRAALTHIVTPRLFFPYKADLPSDSDMVRKYSNVMVAGREQNTSIAFGYAAEAYIDFGVPGMFLPVFFYGLAMGLAYALFRRAIWHREIFVAFATVTFWLSLYLFERSWATMLGVSVGFIVYLGIPLLLLDRFLLVRHSAQQRVAEPLLFPHSRRTVR
jgi:hypothetical protein